MKWLAQTSPDALPTWIGTAISVPAVMGLWWTERRDRLKAEERERTVLVQTMEKLFAATATLDRAMHVVDTTRKG